MSDFLFTSESVSEGHPDKVADQISDAVLDAILEQDPTGRVAAETLVSTGLVVMSGEIDMDLDGTVVHLEAGDVMVQRGTIHNWINKGKEPCVIAFALIDAKPVNVGGKVLNAAG